MEFNWFQVVFEWNDIIIRNEYLNGISMSFHLKKRISKRNARESSSGNQVEKRTFKWISSGVIVYGFFFSSGNFQVDFSISFHLKIPLENQANLRFQVVFKWNSYGILMEFKWRNVVSILKDICW